MKEKKKKEIFSNIIGYDNIKQHLKRTIDVLNNPEKYKKLGSSIPKGLFLYGPPGIGKTCIAKNFIDYTNRKSYIVRKNKADENFIEHLNDIFKQAKETQPSLILLDDLDKFSEAQDKKSSKEFATVQSLIDEVKDDDIFIIATANRKYDIPDSLLRSGRFDIIVEVENPRDEDSYKIIKHYLSNKQIDKNVNARNISYILKRVSCADLENICNEAGIYAGYKNKKSIGMEELIKASLEHTYSEIIDDLNEENEYTQRVAYHEAAHALIANLLQPQSVLAVSVVKIGNNKGLAIYNGNDYIDDIDVVKNKIKILLAGKAALEIVYNKCDIGSDRDTNNAYSLARRLVSDYTFFGFDSISNSVDSSDMVKINKDKNATKILDMYYNEVKQILLQNRNKLDVLANELKEKKILFKEDIYNIINNCNK